MTIGDVAKRAGLRASAIRFYERAGLLPAPVRASGQRRYDAIVLDRLAALERAKACGFSLAEISTLFNGQGPHSENWRRLAERKLADLDAAIERISAMKELLQKHCECVTTTECGRRIRQRRSSAKPIDPCV